MSEALKQEPEAMAQGAPAPALEMSPAPAAWDPFQIMDRMDEEALRRELEGVPSTELVYVVREGGQEVIGLSKSGVDECCIALVSQGQVIREESLDCQLIGEGEDREALFKVTAARYAVHPDKGEVRLDQVIGVKRQPLYHESQALDLDARVPGKKHRGSTYRDLLATGDGRDYLTWMSQHFAEAEIREFVTRILAGETVVAQRGKQLNPHWYEAGAMKAARNARFRLIPGSVRADVIARAREAGKEKVVARAPGAGTVPARAQGEATQGEATQPVTAQPTRPAPAPAAADAGSVVPLVGPYAPTEKQVAFFRRLADSPVFTDAERKAATEWLASKATRQSIKSQIDWLKRQVEVRRPGASGDNAA